MFEDIIKPIRNIYNIACCYCKSKNVSLYWEKKEEYGTCHVGIFDCHACGGNFIWYLDEMRKQYNKEINMQE